MNIDFVKLDMVVGNRLSCFIFGIYNVYNILLHFARFHSCLNATPD